MVKLIMDIVPLYLIGSILGILSSIVLLILHFPEVLDKVKKGARWLLKRLLGLPKMIKGWWWWRQCQPTWQIVKHGDIRITKKSGTEISDFYIEVPVTINYFNRDRRCDLKIDRTPLLLLHHMGRGKEGSPFELHDHSRGIHLIKPFDSHQIDYLFNLRVEIEPQLKEKADCKVVDKGDAWISTHSHYLSGNLKRKGESGFVAKVAIINDVERACK
jgi:hypothetical protein